MIKIYCDGSARANGSKNNCGGAGVCALIFDDPNDQDNFRIDYTWKQTTCNTTNNQQELTALINAIDLATTKYADRRCTIYSDSAYCVNMCRDWIWTWANNGWKNSKKQIVENYDLVVKLYARLTEKDFANYTIEKIAGHCGDIGNELADALATDNKAKLDKIFYQYDTLYKKLKDFDIK